MILLNMENVMSEIYLGHIALWDGEAATKVFEAVCQKYGVRPDIVQQLVAAQREKDSKSSINSKQALHERFDEILES
ncbi:MAG: hypothetical protein RL344_1517 [Pseudomonadota bacterium]